MEFANEIVASGELYKQGSQRKSWNLRRFILSGISLIYFDPKGVKKGEFDITGCTVRKISAEEIGTPQAVFAFVIDGPSRKFIATASNEKNRAAWIQILQAQIEEFREPIRRFLYAKEIVHGNGLVKEKGVMGGYGGNYRMVVTNYPRALLIDDSKLVLKSQMSWRRDQAPSFEKVFTSQTT